MTTGGVGTAAAWPVVPVERVDMISVNVRGYDRFAREVGYDWVKLG